jgi:hypothetical protein
MARDGAAAAPAARKIKLKVGGAKEGTRTLTGVTRWNLNPVRLPIPPLSHRLEDCKPWIFNEFRRRASKRLKSCQAATLSR